MSRNTIHIFLSFLILVVFTGLSFHYVSANTPKTLSITKNYQKFIDFKKYPDFAQLYHSGGISLTITPDTNLKIIEKDDSLVFWVQPGVMFTGADLEILVADALYSFPLSLEIQKDYSNFDITDDIYNLSLQEKPLSCESAAAADIIETFIGAKMHEDEVINNLPKGSHYNTLPIDHPGDVQIWGNPNLGFVGYIQSIDDITAKQKLMTGYGVYEGPISDVYQDSGLHTEIFNISHHTDGITPDLHLRYILEKLKSGSMVQLWGDWCTRLEYDDGVLENKSQISTILTSQIISAKNTCYNVDQDRSLTWKYYDINGELVEHIGLDGEHAFILLGWQGDIANPTHIRVWDTDTGYHLYPIIEWVRKWEAMDYRSIIITKKDS